MRAEDTVGNCADRRRDQHQIGAAHRARAGSGAIASMMPSSSASFRFAALRPTPTTCAHGLGLLQRERERAADQADADDRELSPHHSFRLAASAARKLLVLLGRADRDAQVLRHAVAPPTGRTITPRRSRRL